MLVDFKAPILTIRGKVLEEMGERVDVGALVVTLLSVFPAAPNLPAVTRKLRVGLTMRILQASAPIDVNEAETKIIDELLMQSTLPPFYAEQVAQALEGKANPAAVLDAASVVPIGNPNGKHITPA